MKHNNTVFEKLNRRSFLGATAVLTAGTLLPSVLSCENGKQAGKSAQLTGKISDEYAGVQIGVITYSFRSLEGGLETTLKACVEAGVSSVELMGTDVEDYLGAPKNPVLRHLDEKNPLTSEEKTAIEQYKSELKEWRKTKGTPDSYTQLRKKFNDVGVNIHIAEVLHLIRDQKWPIYCDIELEYPIVPWSSSIKEVKTCREYCRQILL